MRIGRPILPALLLALALAAGAFCGWIAGRRAPGGYLSGPASTPALLRQVQSLSRLLTVKYVIQKVVLLEDVKWYGENRLLLVAHGVVNAGIDLESLQPDDIQLSGPTVRIRLPGPAITDVYLDEQKTQVIEHSTGLLRQFDKNLEQIARRRAVDEIRRAARHEGIQEEAAERAREQIRQMFQSLGFGEVIFISP